MEQGAQFPLPIAHQAGRRHDEHPPDAAAAQHLPHRQAGHDGLAGAGVIGQQEADGVLGQNVLVNGDALVRQRVDAGDLAGEGGVELVAEGQSMGLRRRQNRFGVAGEIQSGRRGWQHRRRHGRRCLKLLQPLQRQAPGRGLAGLPAQHG